MTTKVTVDAHAGWPVKVTAFDKREGQADFENEPIIVAPNTEMAVYVHSGRKLVIEEMPLE